MYKGGGKFLRGDWGEGEMNPPRSLVYTCTCSSTKQPVLHVYVSALCYYLASFPVSTASFLFACWKKSGSFFQHAEKKVGSGDWEQGSFYQQVQSTYDSLPKFEINSLLTKRMPA